MTEVQYSNIVAITALDQLGLLNRWVMWRPIDRNGKPTKVPFIAGSKMEASSTDPETWRDAYTALDWLCENAELYKDGGIGIALGDLGDGFHLCGIDLDSCTDTQGNIAEWAFPFLDILSGTYVEISPSRAGLKAFFFATAEDAGEARRLFGSMKVLGDASEVWPKVFVIMGQRSKCILAVGISLSP
jgi:primase-polymerase (primpol)-like protein